MKCLANAALLTVLFIGLALGATTRSTAAEKSPETSAAKKIQRLLYVTVPDGAAAGITRGQGILIYDIDNGHKLLRQIDIPDIGGTRGVCASAETNKLYYSHSHNKLVCMDLVTEKRLWEKNYEKAEGGCDRIEILPDGSRLYVPSGWWSEYPYWKVIDGADGHLVDEVKVAAGAHDTICSHDGRYIYCGCTKFNMFSVIDTTTNTVVKQAGPLSGVIWPFSVNGAGTIGYINVDHFVGFEICDLRSGEVLHKVRVKGLEDQVRRCHGIGLTPDEKEVWLVDQEIHKLYVYDATVMPPKMKMTINTAQKTHGWITFSIDGQWAYPDTGDIIDAKTKEIVATLTDANGDRVCSSKFVEIQFLDGDPIRVGSQQAVGRVYPPTGKE